MKHQIDCTAFKPLRKGTLIGAGQTRSHAGLHVDSWLRMRPGLTGFRSDVTAIEAALRRAQAAKNAKAVSNTNCLHRLL